MLCEAMRATQDLEIRENIVQLLWDLEAQNRECHFEHGGRRAAALLAGAGAGAIAEIPKLNFKVGVCVMCML